MSGLNISQRMITLDMLMMVLFAEIQLKLQDLVEEFSRKLQNMKKALIFKILRLIISSSKNVLKINMSMHREILERVTSFPIP